MNPTATTAYVDLHSDKVTATSTTNDGDEHGTTTTAAEGVVFTSRKKMNLFKTRANIFHRGANYTPPKKKRKKRIKPASYRK